MYNCHTSCLCACEMWRLHWQVFNVRGDGREWSETRNVNGLLTAATAQLTATSIGAGGLHILGGATVSGGGLAVDDGVTNIATASDEVSLVVGETPTSGYSSTVLKVQSTQVRVRWCCGYLGQREREH